MHHGLVPFLIVTLSAAIFLPIYGVLASRKEESRAQSVSPTLPLRFRGDRFLAALFGLPSFAVAVLLFGITVAGLCAFGTALEHPILDLVLSLVCFGGGLLMTWIAWGFGHNLIWPDLLNLTDKGLTYGTPGRLRSWRWDEIVSAKTVSAPGGAPLSGVIIVVKEADPFMERLVRWRLWKDAHCIPLGKMWKAPFGTRSGVLVTDAIQAVLNERQEIRRDSRPG